MPDPVRRGLHALNATPSALRRRLRREWLMLAVAGIVAMCLAFWIAGAAGKQQTLAALDERLGSLAHSQAGMIENIRSKYRALPSVLAEDEALKHLLDHPPATLAGAIPAAPDALNRKLSALALETGAAVLYVINAQGRTIAASNWEQPDSFVGGDFSFRPYFKDALANGQGEYFALGTSSSRPGLYFSTRIQNASGQTIGAVVAKLEFLALEQDWQRYPDTIFVTDSDGIVILSSRPGWLFQTYQALPPERLAALQLDRPFGDAALMPLGLRSTTDAGRTLLADQLDNYLAYSMPIPGSRWTLHALAPTRAALASDAGTARLTAMLAVFALLALSALALQRSQRARESAYRQALQRRELEQMVRERTEALRQANGQLESEMQALQASRARARALREQLEQADKLSFLGQISAGVAHEINQPVAALRMYAANIRTYLDRNDTAAACKSLDAVDALTQRIGLITAQLCHYARVPAEESADINLREALDNALLLLAHRIRQQQAELDIHGIPPSLHVQAAQVRLEQVFTNLIRNALDAVAGQAQARITLNATAQDGKAVIHLRDNGPGIAPAMRQRLFLPFASGRSDGMGLGLLISHDIVTAFGGTLEECSAPGEGAHFIITLPLSQT